MPVNMTGQNDALPGPFHFPMDDDGLFDMLIDDNTILSGPSFLVSVHDDSGNVLPNSSSSESPTGDIRSLGTGLVDFPDALLPNTPFPSAMDDGTPQEYTLMFLGGEVLPLDLSLESNGTPLPHVPEATISSWPSWSCAAQELILDPPPTFQLQDNQYSPGGQILVADPAESFAPTLPGLGELDVLRSPILEPGPVMFGALTPSLNHFGLPSKASGHVTDQSRRISGSKRPFDDTQSPKRPDKRHRTIQPKPSPMPPSQAGNASETTPGCDLNVGGKQGDIPVDMLATFKIEGSGMANPSDKRTRSKKVCLKCQSLRKKCDGIFPCQHCRDSGHMQRRKLTRIVELPCFDADISELNFFHILAPLYSLLRPKEDKISAPTLATFMDASAAVLQEMGDYWKNNQKSLIFAGFSRTRIPQDDFLGTFCPPRSAREKLCPGSETCLDALSWLAAVNTQGRVLAMISHTTDIKVEHWLLEHSLAIFGKMKKLAIKVLRGKASLKEKHVFGQALGVFLLASRICATWVFTAAHKKLAPYSAKVFADGRRLLGQCAKILLEKKEYLRLWTRHWLMKLYGDSTHTDLFNPNIFGALLTTARCEQEFRSSFVREAVGKNLLGGLSPDENTPQEDIVGSKTNRRYQYDDYRDSYGPYLLGVETLGQCLALFHNSFP